ncbi:MAG: hypothetical protein WAN10_02530 [Candidatus Acidiferrales bacterium]
MCDANGGGAARGKAAELLASYRWSEPDNTILFECIRELLGQDSRHILLHLPAALTRRGFPDISCDGLAASPQINEAEALALAEELLGASQ